MTDTAPMTAPDETPPSNALAVFANRPFLLLWLSQAATQIGGNMVLYGLTVLVFESTGESSSAVSALLLTFLVPAVLFSAWAGVYVDRYDRRVILVVTNILRAAAFVALFFSTDYLLLVYALNIFISIMTVFFTPAEAAMIPHLVPRSQLISANGIFTLTLNASFAIGFALLGPLLVRVTGPELLIVVALLYLLAALFCFTLPSSRSRERTDDSSIDNVSVAEQSVGSVVGQLREGFAYIRGHRQISWSLIYLGITASLIGVLGVLGPAFATEALGLDPKDFVVVVLPLGFGIVSGVLILNGIRTLVPRRRLMEGGLIALGVLLGLLSIAGPVSRLLQQATDPAAGIVDLSTLTSLLSVVVAIAFLAGVAYAFVAIPAQTQLQEDLPADVRGRVFGVLNMLLSVASFVPIIVVGTISDLIGAALIIFVVASIVGATGVASVLIRGPLRPIEAAAVDERGHAEPMDPLAIALHADPRYEDDAALPSAGHYERPSSEPPTAGS